VKHLVERRCAQLEFTAGLFEREDLLLVEKGMESGESHKVYLKYAHTGVIRSRMGIK